MLVYPEIVTAAQKRLYDRIVWVDPERMSGIPCFRGTRVPVQCLIDHLDGLVLNDEFFEGFPSVTRLQARKFIELYTATQRTCVPS